MHLSSLLLNPVNGHRVVRTASLALSNALSASNAARTAANASQTLFVSLIAFFYTPHRPQCLRFHLGCPCEMCC